MPGEGLAPPDAATAAPTATASPEPPRSTPDAGPPRTEVLGTVEGIDTAEWAGESIGAKPSVYIDDQLKLDYGITASDPAFQNLINGLRNYKIALGQAINSNAAIVPLDGDSVLRASQFILQPQEVLVCLQVRIVLHYQQQARERAEADIVAADRKQYEVDRPLAAGRRTPLLVHGLRRGRGRSAHRRT